MKAKNVGLGVGLLLTCGAIGIIFSNLLGAKSTSNFPVTTPSVASPTPSLNPVSLLCLDKSTKLLRTSNVVDQCLATEDSLGAYRIPIPSEYPRDLNPFFKIRSLAAQAAAKRVGVTLAITSGFRSYATQAALFAEALTKYGSVAAASKWVLPPNLSHHVLGLALDINYPNDPKSTKWLEINGSKFGICRVYTNEWWHFEGVVPPGGHCPKLMADATIALLAD
jgi:hypothetical protein